jgi:hypothetical protein
LFQHYRNKKPKQIFIQDKIQMGEKKRKRKRKKKEAKFQGEAR